MNRGVDDEIMRDLLSSAKDEIWRSIQNPEHGGTRRTLRR